MRLLGLRYVVLTSVARDDLPDQGSGWFATTDRRVRRGDPWTQIEVLTPDFWGGRDDSLTPEALQAQRVAIVVAANPACYNHNIQGGYADYKLQCDGGQS